MHFLQEYFWAGIQNAQSQQNLLLKTDQVPIYRYRPIFFLEMYFASTFFAPEFTMCCLSSNGWLSLSVSVVEQKVKKVWMKSKVFIYIRLTQHFNINKKHFWFGGQSFFISLKLSLWSFKVVFDENVTHYFFSYHQFLDSMYFTHWKFPSLLHVPSLASFW